MNDIAAYLTQVELALVSSSVIADYHITEV
jgi:hypothetical protein